MLVLTRKIGESITVTDQLTGEQIVIKLTEIDPVRHRGRIGITCDKERFRILRNELLPKGEDDDGQSAKR